MLAPSFLKTFQSNSSSLLSSTLSHYHNFWQDLVELHFNNPTPATSHLLEKMPSNQAVQEMFAANQLQVLNSWADRQPLSKLPPAVPRSKATTRALGASTYTVVEQV